MVILLVIIVWSIAVASVTRLLVTSIPYLYIHNDAFVYYVAGKLISLDLPLYGLTNSFKAIKEAYGLDFHWHLGYIYPPLFAYLVSLFSFIPPQLFAWTLWTVNTFCIWLWTRIANREFSNSITTVLLCTLLFPPLLGSLAMGQVNILFLLLFCYFLLSSNTYMRAGALTGMIFLKVYPLAFLPLLCLRKEKLVFFQTVAFLFLGVVVSILLFGRNDYGEYILSVLPQLQQDRNVYFVNQSLNPFIMRLFISLDKQTLSIAPELFTGIVSVVAGSIILYFLNNTKKEQVATLVYWVLWMNVISLLAGRMTYWNYLPSLIGILLLFSYRDALSVFQYRIFILTLFLGYGLWWGTYLISEVLPVQTGFDKIIFSICTSLGFIVVLVQSILLIHISPAVSQPHTVVQKK